jgi:hypothetical protein
MEASMDDEEAIRNLIGEHFEALKWEPGANPDWRRFKEDFLRDALLFGAARPVQARTVDGFIERMESVARANLSTFEEHTRGMKIQQFGNVAVVLAISELLENGSEVNHDVSAYLLVKSDGRWFIAAHAWDQASDEKPIPDGLR